MKGTFKPYEGAEKYIFVSYSHKDCERVLAILEELNKEGFRIWYDEGIEWGTEWPESIANHLDGCAVFMAFLSKTSIASRNCRQEVNYALKQGKEILSVYLEEVELSKGMDMQLSSYHSTFPYQYADQREFYSRLSVTQLIQCCRDVGAIEHPIRKMVDSEPPREKEEMTFWTLMPWKSEGKADMPGPAASQGDVGSEQGDYPVDNLACPQDEPLKQKEYPDPQTVCGASEGLTDDSEQTLREETVTQDACKVPDGLEEFWEQAQQGEIEAQIKLGDCYYHGKGVQQDYAEAVKWYRKAFEINSDFLADREDLRLDLQKKLGDCYYSGYGVQQDYSEAIKWYREAGERGDISARLRLGLCYERLEDYVEAIKWYRNVAEQVPGENRGDHIFMQRAQEYLGNYYYDRKSYKKAVKWYRKFVEWDDLDFDDMYVVKAQLVLGDCFYDGKGIQQDYAEAVKWYRKALKNDSFHSQLLCDEKLVFNSKKNLADCYYYGRGIKQDYPAAIKWYRKASQLNPMEYDLKLKKFDAQEKLGDCYYDGTGAQQDYGEAAKWYLQVVSSVYFSNVRRTFLVSRNMWIYVKLGDCYFWGGTGIQQDRAEAEKWYQKAAESGDADFKEKLANHRKENERQARRKSFENFIRKFTPGGRKEQ